MLNQGFLYVYYNLFFVDIMRKMRSMQNVLVKVKKTSHCLHQVSFSVLWLRPDLEDWAVASQCGSGWLWLTFSHGSNVFSLQLAPEFLIRLPLWKPSSKVCSPALPCIYYGCCSGCLGLEIWLGIPNGKQNYKEIYKYIYKTDNEHLSSSKLNRYSQTIPGEWISEFEGVGRKVWQCCFPPIELHTKPMMRT